MRNPKLRKMRVKRTMMRATNKTQVTKTMRERTRMPQTNLILPLNRRDWFTRTGSSRFLGATCRSISTLCMRSCQEDALRGVVSLEIIGLLSL